MRLLIYNIAYGTGSPGAELRRAFTTHRYLAAPERPFRKIVNFIVGRQPDVVGLIEADSGSRRTHGVNQIEHLAKELGHHSFYNSKYAPGSTLGKLPYMRHQANALMTNCPDCSNKFSFLPRGSKRLVIACRAGGINFILVHLALTRQIRRLQLDYLSRFIMPGEPTVLAGDFNTFGGEQELSPFLAATGLRNADTISRATYPAWKPGKQLDYILLSPEVELLDFHIPRVRFSDHLPLIADLRLADRT